ncbi:MAG: hypothetical protein HYZ17_14680 [Betaproteobacteria bacterium]|nr:hypothetical protein [Betaproteobacteria bacterium]
MDKTMLFASRPNMTLAALALAKVIPAFRKSVELGHHPHDPGVQLFGRT